MLHFADEFRDFAKTEAIAAIRDSDEVPANKRVFIKLIKKTPTIRHIKAFMSAIGYKRDVSGIFIKRGQNQQNI